jgi:integrase
MKATLTKTFIQSLPELEAGANKLRVFDDRLPGFIAEKRPGGVTFYMRYIDARRRTREVKLGRLGDVTLEQARKAAEKLRSQVSLGEDPLAERDRKRAVPTVAEFAEGRYIPHAKENQRSADCTERYLRLRIVPAIGRKAMDEVTQADVAALRAKMVADGLAPATINRHLACLRAMFNRAIRWQVIEGRNPASSPGMLREEPRDRYLTPEQTRALVAALDQSHCTDAAAALVLLAATGARKQEVLKATWDMVDLERCALTVPRSKNGRPRQIPLSPFAIALMRRQLARREGDCTWVFPSWSRDGQPMLDVRRTWATAKKRAGLPKDLRIHDLRHSFASALANQGVALFEIGAVLGHRQLSTTTRYAHHAPERLVATAAVAAKAWDLAGETEAA